MIHDISLSITEDMVCWEGDPRPQITRFLSMSEGNPCNSTKIAMGSHTGTHIDAPRHFIPNGQTVDDISLERLIGRCRVLHLDTDTQIEKKDLVHIDLSNCRRILFKTNNSKHWDKDNKDFNRSFVSIGISAARHLVKLDIDLVGIDYLSVESYYSKNNEVHKTLLAKSTILLEGLNLSQIDEGEYDLICLPLKIPGVEGVPARTILMDIE